MWRPVEDPLAGAVARLADARRRLCLKAPEEPAIYRQKSQGNLEPETASLRYNHLLHILAAPAPVDLRTSGDDAAASSSTARPDNQE